MYLSDQQLKVTVNVLTLFSMKDYLLPKF